MHVVVHQLVDADVPQLHLDVLGLQARQRTQLVSQGDAGGAGGRGHQKLLRGDSRNRREAEVLEERSQEDEELHSGQSLTGTGPGTCKRGGLELRPVEGPEGSTSELRNLRKRA